MFEPIVETLENGLKLVTINLDGFHTVTNFLVIRSGSRYETSDNNGIAHFLEHMVFKGTKSFANSKEIAQAIEGVGGYFNAWTANDHTAYWNIVPETQWRHGIQVASELAFTPKLRAEDLERERGVIIEEIRRLHDDPSHLVDDLLGPVLFKDHPLGQSVIGTEETILAMTIEQFRDYHRAHYAPSQAYFVVVGNLKGKDISAEISAQLAEFKPQAVSKPKLFTGNSKKGLNLYKKQTDQTHFMLASALPGLSIQHKDRFVGSVLNAVLGRGMSSRLFLNIREKKGLAYAINSNIQPFEDTGAVMVYGGVNTGKIGLALEALEEELKSLQQVLVPEDELGKAKALVTGSFDLTADRPVDLATWYGTSALLGAKESFEQAKDLVSKVTAKEIQQLAQELFKKDRLAMSVVGPYQDSKIFDSFLGL